MPLKARGPVIMEHCVDVGSGLVEIFGVGRVRVRVSKLATGMGRVAKMVDPHTSTV